MARPRKRISKERIANWLKQRFFLRLHMFWILAGTFFAGLLTTNVLLRSGVETLWVRYTISVAAAYLVFLFLIRLWLWYIGRATAPEVEPGGEESELAVELFSSLRRSTVPEVGGGGRFGGSGATGSWGDAVVDEGTALASTAPSDLPGCLDADEGVIVVVLAVLVFALVAAGIYVIWAAPVILAEAAFEAALAAALARSAKRIDRPGWVGRVWRATALPFVLVMIAAAVAGGVAQWHCPEATRLRDAIDCARRPAG